MLEADIRQVYLVDELQLGQRLNQALQGGHQAEFALLLSMLSPDVTDAPQHGGIEAPSKAEADLRARFGLQPPQRSYAENSDFEREQKLTELFAAQGQNAVHLACCLRPEPLVPVKHDLSPDVFNELPPLKQEKVRRRFAGEKLSYDALPGSIGGFAVLDEISEAAAAI